MPPSSKGAAAAAAAVAKICSMKQKSNASLFNELLECNAFFDRMVDMIPSKIYLAGQQPNQGDEEFEMNSKYFKQASKESKDAKRAALKAAKRRRLDPKEATSTTAQQAKLEEERRNKLAAATEEEFNGKNGEKGDDTKDEERREFNKSRIELLRSRLHAKIAEKAKQGNRPAPHEVSKRAARRAAKLQRQKERKEKKQQESTKVVKQHFKIEEKTPSSDLERLEFGRLTGLNAAADSAVAASNYLAANKALANLSKPKNLQKLIANAEAKRQRLEELKASTNADDQILATKMQWSDTFKEADGARVKDDPAKLKKQLKRKAQKKAKSAKAWKSRLDQVAESKADKQAIRKHNLNQRKQGGAVGANLSKKRIVDNEEDKDAGRGAGGRQQSRAGFEGRKQDFLNQGGKTKKQ